MKKLTLICGLFISAMVMMTSCGKASSEREIATAPDFIPFQTDEDGDFGLLSKDGKVLFADEFTDKINPAFGGIFVKGKLGDFSLYKAEQKPVALKGYEELYDAGAMQEGLMPITKKDERISFIDKEGEVQFTLNPHKGKEIVEVGYFSDGLAPFRLEDGKCGFIDKKGKVVIEPKYTLALSFNDGIAFVESEKNDLLMIDKTGKVIKKINKLIPLFGRGLEESIILPLYTSQWIDGELICIEEDKERCVSINKKGEIVKKYPKNLLIIDRIGDNYVYFSEKEAKYGVNNSKDEEIIRPKYNKLQTIDKNTFLAEKSNSEIVIINKDSEVIKELDDYKDAFYYNGIIYAERINNKYELLDAEGEPLSKEEFIIDDLSELWNPCAWSCKSDYFNPKELAKKIAASIDDKGIGDLVIGSAFNIGKPEDYVDNGAYFTDLTKVGVNANILSHKGYLAMIVRTENIETKKYENIITSRYDEAKRKYIYSFNPKAQIAEISFNAYINGDESLKGKCQKAIEISKTLVAELKAKGWKTYAEGEYICYLTKGDLSVGVAIDNSYEFGVSSEFFIFKGRLKDKNELKTFCKRFDETVEDLLAVSEDLEEDVSYVEEIRVETVAEQPAVEQPVVTF